MAHIGVAAALPHEIDRFFGEADWCIGQWQAEDALLRTRPPGDYPRIVVNAEVGDAEARRGIDEPHHPMLEAGIAKALEVIDAAGARLPMGHARPHRLVLGEGLVHDVAGDGFAMRRSDRNYVLRLWVLRIRSQILIRGCLHANSETIDGGEGAVGKSHDLIAR